MNKLSTWRFALALLLSHFARYESKQKWVALLWQRGILKRRHHFRDAFVHWALLKALLPEDEMVWYGTYLSYHTYSTNPGLVWYIPVISYIFHNPPFGMTQLVHTCHIIHITPPRFGMVHTCHINTYMSNKSVQYYSTMMSWLKAHL